MRTSDAPTDGAWPDSTLVRTRESLHAVAEHVLAAARYRAIGRIGLVVSTGGFATPPFGPSGTVVAVDGVDLVVREQTGGSEETGDGPAGEDGLGTEHRAPLSTVRAAADLVGIPPGGPGAVYPLATPLEPDRPLEIDPIAAGRLAAWYALGDAALRRLRAEIAADEPSEITLWPEHADVALSAAGVNYGASPGDESVPAPYLYVGPASPPPPDDFWNAPFGAALTWDDVHDEEAALAFFRAGRARLTA
jgi:hypothetical protein